MDINDIQNLQEAYNQIYQVDEAKQESEEEDWRKSEIRNLRRHRQTGTRTPYTDRIVSHAKGRGVKKERGSKIQREETEIDEAKTSKTTVGRIPDFENEKKAKQVPGLRVNKPALVDEETAEVGQDPSKSTNPKVRAQRQLQIRRAEAPKNVGVPSQSQGYSSLKDSVDLFDVIKGYLLDEGYADTEEAAVAIMANMSEEWRENIAELYGAGFSGSAGFALSKPKSSGGGSAAQKLQPRSREFEKVPPSSGKPKPSGGGSATIKQTGPSSPGYDTRRIGGYDLRRLAK